MIIRSSLIIFMQNGLIYNNKDNNVHLPSPQGELFPVSSSSIFPNDVVVVPWSPALWSELLDTSGCQGPDFRLSIVCPRKDIMLRFFVAYQSVMTYMIIKLHEKLKLNDNQPLILLLNFCDFLSWSCRKVVYTTNHKYTDNNNGSTEIENCISNFQHYICTKLISI